MSESNKISHLLLLPRFRYINATTIEEACSLLAQYQGKAKMLAGGTDLLVSMKKREEIPEVVIGIKNIPGLDYIKENSNGGLNIGALTTHSSVSKSKLINEKFEFLAEACRKVGTPQVRNMGTLAGNICRAGPSQDTIPALLTLEANIKLIGDSGERIIPISEFFTGPFQCVCKSNEIITEIQIPLPPSKYSGSYKWLTKRTTVDETLAGAAVLIVTDNGNHICQDVRIGLTSVAPYPFRAKQAEEILRGQPIDDQLVKKTGQVAAEETKPRSSAAYRNRMTSVLVQRSITEAWQKLQ